MEFLDAAEADGKRGIWLNAPLDATHLVPVAVEMGFGYHHADEEGATLTLWLPEDEENGLPKYPHIGHGVGGIVLNSRGEVLGIQEKAGVTAGMTDFWKIPGGLVDRGEDMHVAAVREVEEETGLKTKFVAIASIRESQTGPFDTTARPSPPAIHTPTQSTLPCNPQPPAPALSTHQTPPLAVRRTATACA